jgi:multicomponent Na+:H+ antiporter subunit D
MRAENEQHQTRFYACFAIALSATMGIAFSGNMLTLFIFYEILTISTYPLVIHTESREAIKAGRTYLGILIGTSVAFLLLAIIWTWHLTGTLDFTPGGILAGKADGPVVGVLLFLFIYGTGKAALMPFHRWLPAAMVAPTPVSALLHAVAVVKAGVFTVVKVIVYIFGIDLLAETTETNWLLYIAAATIIIASLVALRQDNLKLRLAYSTISQLSYIILAAALATDLSIIGGSMHLAMHAFGKITLFFCAGAILVASHKTDVSQMDGLGRTMPFTFFAFFIGAMSVIGLPPLGGSWSKWFMMMGALEADQVFFVFVFMASSLLNVAYLMPVVARAYFLPPKDVPHPDAAPAGAAVAPTGLSRIKEAPAFCLLAMGISSAGSIILFFYADKIFNLLLPITQVAG